MHGSGSTRFATGLLVSVVLLASSASAALPRAGRHPERAPRGMSSVGPAIYRPLYPASPAERTVQVRRFWLDVRPVTNADFLSFVRLHPEWRRDRVKSIFADEGYLSHWAGPDSLGAARVGQPVVRVS